MEIVSLFGCVKNYDNGLSKITSIAHSTLAELGMQVKEINLGPPTTIPFYDGIKSQVANDFISMIKAATGIIFATTASVSGVSSILGNFLEHLQTEPNVLKHKNCMIIVVSTTGDINVINNLSKTITTLGGYDGVRIFLDEGFFGTQNNKEIIEKQVEDFYRIVRQKRKFYSPNVLNINNEIKPQSKEDTIIHGAPNPNVESHTWPVVQTNQAQNVGSNTYADQMAQFMPNTYGEGSTNYTQAPTINTTLSHNNIQHTPVSSYVPQSPLPTLNNPNQVYNNPSNISSVVDTFNKRQTEDVKEITNFFSKKFDSGNTALQVDVTPQPQQAPFPTNIATKTTRQLTANLVHYYQPQLAGDLSCTIQVNVTGNASFNGYIVITGTECYYYDGTAENPTLTVISDETSWLNVITGKTSAQKSFMTGSIKIKGNFVLLTKFDQIFSTSKNY